jgi:hypothetical protein
MMETYHTYFPEFVLSKDHVSSEKLQLYYLLHVKILVKAVAYSNLTRLITKKYLKDTQLLPIKLYLENDRIIVNFFLLKIYFSS